MDALDFFKTAIQDYRAVGAVCESSKFAVRQVVECLGRQSAFVVEFGAGNGTVTKHILKNITPDGKVVAVEFNHAFLPELKAINDPRLIVIEGDAVEIAKNFHGLGLPRVDAVISGIPFTFIQKEHREGLIRDVARGLSSGGRFIVYQTTPLVFPLLRRYFKSVRIRLEPRNIPPYFIMMAEK